MVAESPQPSQFESVRTLIRYVDADQAVIEVHVVLRKPLPTPGSTRRRLRGPFALHLELRTNDGFHDEQRLPLPIRHRHGKVRLEVVRPHRWWPAGMGEQPLYELSICLVANGEPADNWSTTVGFTSVRPRDDRVSEGALLSKTLGLLVNGQQCDIDTIMAIDQVDEHRLLPATGDSLLIVRDHYGPDILYRAADRAGILVIQCVPIHPGGRPETEVPSQVSRLAAHPSLAGWFIGHLGDVSHRIARRLRRLDPTHGLMLATPDQWAA